MMFFSNLLNLLFIFLFGVIYVYLNILLINRLKESLAIILVLIDFWLALLVSIPDYGKEIKISLPTFLIFSIFWIIGAKYAFKLIVSNIDNQNVDENRKFFALPNENNIEYWFTCIEKIIFTLTLITMLSVLVTREYNYSYYPDILFIFTGSVILGTVLPFFLFYYLIKYLWSISILIDMENFLARNQGKILGFFGFLFRVFIILIILFGIFLFVIKMALYLSPL